MKINFSRRAKNPVFIAQIILAIITPVLAYAGLTTADLTTWGAVLNLLKLAVSNPYVLSLVIVSVFNAITDPTTSGIGDSNRVLYGDPHVDEFCAMGSGDTEEAEDGDQ